MKSPAPLALRQDNSEVQNFGQVKQGSPEMKPQLCMATPIPSGTLC